MQNSYFERRRSLLTHAGMLAAAGLLVSCTPDKPQFNSVDITGGDLARDFSLPDHNGKLRSLNDFRGKVVTIFFGFTHCPDVCPTGMAEMAEVKKLLGAD